MATPRPKYVIFDLGNVLVHIHPEAFLRTLGIDTTENRRYYQPRVIEIIRRYERGDDTTVQYLEHLDGLFNPRDGEQEHFHGAKRVFSSEEFRHAMLAVIGEPIEGMERLVRRVASTTPIGLLSNTNPLHFDFCMENLHVLQFIPTHFLSYRLKSLKPDPDVFAQVIELLQFDPGDVLYIDDLPENVNAAQSVGFNVSLFVGQTDLEEQLSKLKLI